MVRKGKYNNIVLILITLFIFAAMCGTASAKEISVDKSMGPGVNFTSIQAAING